MILIQPAFYPKGEHRENEIAFCDLRNYRTNFASKLFAKHIKIASERVVIENYRPKFSDVYAYLKEHPEDRDEVIVVSNRDIYFDETIKNANLIGDRDFWCLSKYNHSMRLGMIANRLDDGADSSQDAWVFKRSIFILLFEFAGNKLDIEFGRLCTDSIIAYQAMYAGFRVINPSLTVKSYHVHDDRIAIDHQEREKHRVYGLCFCPRPVHLGCGEQMVGIVSDRYTTKPLEFDLESVAH